MRPGMLLHLAVQNLQSDRKGAAVNAAAACVGVAALVFFVALGLGVNDAARRIFPREARLIEVVPASVSLGPILGGGQLDDAAVARLAALPGVTGAHRKLNLRVPIAANRQPEGMRYNWPQGFVVQIPVVGVEAEFLGGDVPAARFVDRGRDEPMPAVISSRLLEVYNKTISSSWGLRKLPTGLALVGVQLPVQVGYSIVPLKTESEVYEARLELVGVSDRIPVYQLALPLAVVQRLHREYGKEDPGYSGVSLVAAEPEDVPRVAAAVRRMGFSVDEGDRAASERIGTAIQVTTGALALVALLMCALAALAIAQSLSAGIRARAREIAILQAVGATLGDVRALVLAEAGLVGAAGGVVGVALARLAAWGADRTAARLLPDFPFRPETFFHFPAWVLLFGIAVGLGAALLGALAPARAAGRIEPARAIG